MYQIRFENRQMRSQMFGHRYWFYLKDAVEDVPEYLVHWEHFERSARRIRHSRSMLMAHTLLTLLIMAARLAREYGLHLLYKEEFHNVYQAERDHREYKPLLQRMKVVSPSGESQMDEDQWDAASASFLSPLIRLPPHGISLSLLNSRYLSRIRIRKKMMAGWLALYLSLILDNDSSLASDTDTCIPNGGL